MLFLKPFDYLFSDCSEFLTKRSIVAFVNEEPWDMHRPLEEDCKLNFKLMTDNDPALVNEVKCYTVNNVR